MSDALIRFERAALGYGRKTVLSGVDATIARGQTVGLVGPNGSGKTTFLRAVLGGLKPAAGSVRVDREQRFAYVPQADELNLLWPLSVRETIALPLRSRRLFGRLTAEESRAVGSAVEKVGAADFQHSLFRETSGGQRQRALLAQALCQQPQVLLLDEPTRGLDVVAKRDFLNLIDALKSEARLTILLVTHSLHIPLNFTDKVLLFNAGRVTESTPDALVKTRTLEEVYGIPFFSHEAGGLRWAHPVRSA